MKKNYLGLAGTTSQKEKEVPPCLNAGGRRAVTRGESQESFTKRETGGLLKKRAVLVKAPEKGLSFSLRSWD